MKKLFASFTSYSSKDWILLGLRIFLGAMFIFSGFVKLVPIEPFELKFVDLEVATWTTAPFIARFVIALELFLGIMLILNIKPRITIITTIALLIVFTVYLVYDVAKNGNDGNCGCFGTYIVMTPLESIIKNLLLLPVAIVLLRMNKRQFNFWPVLMVSLLFILSVGTPFVVYPLDDLEAHINAQSKKAGYAFPIEQIPDLTIKGQKVDLSRGNYILAFFNVNCDHCKSAAYKLYILSKHQNLPPLYMVMLGNEAQVAAFIKETKADFPYYIFNHNNFLSITGNSFPKVFYVKEGIVKGKFDSMSLTEESLIKAIQEP